MRVRMAAMLACTLLLATTMTFPSAGAGTDRVLTISTSSAHPQVPFQAFDVTPKAFDLDGDGKKELILHNDNRHVYVFDSKTGAIRAELKTDYPSGWGARPLNSPEAVIFESGGKAHVVIANSAASISVFRYDGQSGGKFQMTKLWERRLTECFSDPGMDAKPVLADLDRDGDFEILAQTEENGVYALRKDGSTMWKQCIGGGNGEPAVADLDGDGNLEVVWASDGGVVTAMDGRGGWTKWSYWAGQHNLGAAAMPVGPTIGQVDGVGPLDVVVGARDSHDRTNFENNHAALFVIKGDGKLLWMRQHPQANPLTYTHPIIHDVDNDGKADILWGDWNTQGHKPGNWEVMGPANYYRYDAQGNLIWRTQLNTYWSNKDLALADVDNDGTLEVLANGPGCGGDGIWYLNARTGAKETCVSVHPWKVSRGPVIYDLWGTGTMQLVVPVMAATNEVSGGAVMVLDTHAPYNAPWPHPPGAVKSGGGSPPPPSGSFTVSFNVPDTKNNWWVEVFVSSDRPVTQVLAKVNGDGGRVLQKQSWGAWAASFHVPDGAKVVFEARDGSGNAATSSTYTWGDASQPPPSGFQPTFKLSKNVNEWWVELTVGADRPVQGVTASVNGASPVALEKRSWGAWAKSFHVPAGSTVVFEAKASDGATAKSQSYKWMEGSGGSGDPPPSGDLSATFTTSKNVNEWWVEVKVDANKPLSKVEAQVNGGTWNNLDKNSWGTWAKSFKVPSGAQVTYRATSTDGQSVTGGTTRWP